VGRTSVSPERRLRVEASSSTPLDDISLTANSWQAQTTLRFIFERCYAQRSANTFLVGASLMSTNTILIIVVLILLFGGGWGYSRRGR